MPFRGAFRMVLIGGARLVSFFVGKVLGVDHRRPLNLFPQTRSIS